jgi:NAD(P)-dependent dehydrogenase (short-subunit alcohol dehydrogenase family)
MNPSSSSSSAALVVTGGGRGVGAEVARGAARAGRAVALINRSRSEAALRVVADIEAAGGRAIAIAADIADEAAVVRAFRIDDDELGALGGLVNNAVLAGEPARQVELGGAELDRVIRTNVQGPFLCAREAARRMSTRSGGRGGAIVSMSSAFAVSTGAPGWVHFAASKAAVETMSRGLAKELAADSIRVNVVRLGVIATESRRAQDEAFRTRALAQVPMQRMGTPGEAATAVLWLLSDAASYVSGATLDVAGGM